VADTTARAVLAQQALLPEGATLWNSAARAYVDDGGG
jgi:hypothetical protein